VTPSDSKWFQLLRVSSLINYNLDIQSEEVWQEFYIPAEAYDVVFLKTAVAIPHVKGFEIMHLDR
jgi:hypothetical protein